MASPPRIKITGNADTDQLTAELAVLFRDGGLNEREAIEVAQQVRDRYRAAFTGGQGPRGPIVDLGTRHQLCEAEGVTLNGEPAVIIGARNSFAQVATVRSDGPVAEFAWITVRRIVACGGEFFS